MSWRANWKNLTPYEIHKLLINEYVLTGKSSTQLLQRDTSKDKRDIDVIRENHQFLWEQDDAADTWERKLAKKYYDRLFKEYCIGDLTLYKHNKVGLRWRTEKELAAGKGQFTCGEKHCNSEEELRTWEVNFGYTEAGTKKNALVKLRLCPKCSKRLNYHHKRKEVKRLKNHSKPHNNSAGTSTDNSAVFRQECEEQSVPAEQNIWEETPVQETPSEGNELDCFLDDLFL